MTRRAPLLPLLVSAAVAAGATGCGDAGRSSGSASPDRPPFSGEAALELVEVQVAFGPRVPGTPGHAAQLGWMLAILDTLAPEVVADTFIHRTTSDRDLTLVNVRARFRPDESRRLVLLAHWDTRPTADQEDDPAARALPIPGANDGGSGVAVLLHLARLFAAQPPPVGVDILLVDGEDYGPGADDMFLGARRYAETVSRDDRPTYGVLLDMVGDADPLFPMEGYSAGYALPLNKRVWSVAERLGYGEWFPSRVVDPVGDDHVPLLEAGIPTIDIIDLDYGPDNTYWHTHQDTPEHVRASTLRMVGEVLAEFVYSGG